jgi:glycosyltransferase involved in cell wall biosynthesis
MLKFVVSLLAMDRLETTRKCVASVIANSRDFHLILTDNGSKDGTAQWFTQLAADMPGFITAVLNPDNQLFIPRITRRLKWRRRWGRPILSR